MSDELSQLSHDVVSGRLSRRDFLGRAGALGVTALSASSILARTASAASPQRGGVLKAGLQGGSSTDSLDPATWASQVAQQFGRQWGEQLLQVSPQGELEPCLAEAWDVSRDAKVWTFRIRKDVQFHNGKTLTPEDVRATLERHFSSDSNSAAFGLLTGIESIKVDGGNVVITLKEGNVVFPYIMSNYHLMIQPNGGLDDPAAGVGTGPYKVAVHDPGLREVGERFANYWRDDRGFVESFEIIVLNDTTARLAALQSGQVDMINRVEPKVVDLIERTPDITIRNTSSRARYNFVVHCDTAPFSSNDLRMALKYAIDREEMVARILKGYGSIGNDTPVNENYPLFTELEQRAYDPDKAAFHFKKSGHTDPILLRVSDVAFPGAVDAAQLYQQSAAKAGITINVQREPADGYWSEIWNKKPFCATYWAGRPTQDQVYSNSFVSSSDWNDSHFYREDFDRMLYAARSELDKNKRKQIYADMARMVSDEGGVIVPMFNDFIDATGPRVDGWIPNPSQELMGGYALSKCWLADA